MGSTSTAHLHARAYVGIAVLHQLTLDAYFVDVKIAFAAMCWALAIPLNDSDAAFCERLSCLGFTKCEVSDILACAQSPDRFLSSYGSVHASVLVSNFLQAAWLSSDFISSVIRPKSGTLAGTSLGDMLFITAFTI